MNTGFNGSVALVTGSGRGLGAEIAMQLAAEGCQVVVADRDLEPARTVAHQIEGAGGRALALQVDVAKRQSVADAVRVAQEQLGPVTILVNNAGFSQDASITEMTEEQWDRVLDVCLKGSWLCAQAVVPGMISAGWGRIINISSRAHLGETNKTNYCAAKAGVIGLTSALAMELGKHGITANSVAPGLIRTDRVRSLGHFDDIDRRAKLSTPIQRPGETSDVAAAVLYLASAAAGFVSGETIHVTGGRYSST